MSRPDQSVGSSLPSLDQSPAILPQDRREQICLEVSRLTFEQLPDLQARYGPRGMEACRTDCARHLDHLEQAVAAGEAALFTNYVSWARTLLEGYGVPDSDLKVHLQCLAEVVLSGTPEGTRAAYESILQEGLAVLSDTGREPPSYLKEGEPLAPVAQEYLSALLRADRAFASRMILAEVEQGTSVRDVYLHVFQPVQREIGRLWQLHRISVAQEHFCTAATQLVMSQLSPRIFATPRVGRTLVATCVAGELHEIGLRMVSDFFEMEGWDSYYLGASTPPESVLQTILDRGADLLIVSATLVAHVPAVARLIRRLRESEAADVPVLVGGYPFNAAPGLWRQVGADACSQDAQGAPGLGHQLVERRRK